MSPSWLAFYIHNVIHACIINILLFKNWVHKKFTFKIILMTSVNTRNRDSAATMLYILHSSHLKQAFCKLM